MEVVNVKRSNDAEEKADSIATDGGVAGESDSPFQTVSETQLTRGDRYRKTIDEMVLTPVRIIFSDWRAGVGMAIVLFYVFLGTVGPSLVAYPSASRDILILPFQNMAYPLGTDGLGRNLLDLLVHATPNMLKMITTGAVFATVLGTVWGVTAGYKGGVTDRVMMLFADILMTIPGLPLIILIVALYPTSNPYLLGIILTLNAWAGFARQLRAEVLKLRQNSYVEASRTMGISLHTILLKDILPNIMPLIVVNFVSRARNVIMASVGLYFIGALPTDDLNWGVMMNSAYNQQAYKLVGRMHWLYEPMVLIVIFTLGLLLFGQGCDRIFNPRIRARHSKGSNEDAEAAKTDGETI